MTGRDLFGHAAPEPDSRPPAATPRRPAAHPGVRIVRGDPPAPAPAPIRPTTCWPSRCAPDAASARGPEFHVLGGSVRLVRVCTCLAPDAALARLEAEFPCPVPGRAWLPWSSEPCPHRPGAVHRLYASRRIAGAP